MLIGYLKKISNIEATIRNVGNETIDARVGAGSYKQTRDGGEVHVRAHTEKPSYLDRIPRRVRSGRWNGRGPGRVSGGPRSLLFFGSGGLKPRSTWSLRSSESAWPRQGRRNHARVTIVERTVLFRTVRPKDRRQIEWQRV